MSFYCRDEIVCPRIGVNGRQRERQRERGREKSSFARSSDVLLVLWLSARGFLPCGSECGLSLGRPRREPWRHVVLPILLFLLLFLNPDRSMFHVVPSYSSIGTRSSFSLPIIKNNARITCYRSIVDRRSDRRCDAFLSITRDDQKILMNEYIITLSFYNNC